MFVLFLLATIVFLILMLVKQKNVFKKEYEENKTELSTEVNRLKELVTDYEAILLDKNIQITNLEEDIDVLKKSKAKYIGQFKISYYCACEKCCGKSDAITASGKKAAEGVTVAADGNLLPFGTKIYIRGLGWREVQDRGGAIKGNVLDVYVSSHDHIPPQGTYSADVWVVM